MREPVRGLFQLVRDFETEHERARIRRTGCRTNRRHERRFGGSDHRANRGAFGDIGVSLGVNDRIRALQRKGPVLGSKLTKR
jgi:hypothetical protein